MNTPHMISLGAWCRPAYQIGCFAEKRSDVVGLKGPFDWTITSFRSLANCLEPGFDPTSVLDTGQVVASFAKSGMCTQSQMIFHHEMAPATMAELGSFDPGDVIPQSRALKRLVKHTRGRFAHTYRTLSALQGNAGPILFVRWNRHGHPDDQYPQAFEGESADGLLGALETFLGHDRFHLLTLESDIIEGQREPITDPITRFEGEGRILSCTIRERLGWNGNQERNFRGDELSWQAAFERALSAVT